MAGDPYWANVVSLVYFDDNAGTTLPYDTVLDEQWVRSGEAVIQDTVTLFGDNTGYCDGTGDRFYSNTRDAFQLGTEDFTVEAWIRPVNGGAGSAYGRIFQFGINTTNNGLYIVRLNNPDPLRTLVQGYSGSQFNNVFTAHTPIDIPNDVWTHYALVRKDGVFTEFIGGVEGSSNNPTWDDNFTQRVVHLSGNSIGGETFRGYWSNFRLTKGIARYTTSFAPPTEKFPATSQLLVTDPASIIVAAGDDAIFTGSASEGEAPYTYQWYEVTAGLLAGQTDAVLTLPAVDETYDGTDYYYIATDNVGQTATSGTASLNVEGSTNPVLTNYEDALVMDASGVWQSLTKPLIDDTKLVRDFTWSSNQIATIAAQRTRWKGEWAQVEYVKNDQVEDQSWLMIANKTTTDPAAPTPQGDPIEIYPPPDPTWTINNYVGHVYSVLETSAPPDGLYSVTNLEVWIQGVTADDNYQVLIQDGVSGAFREVLSFTGDVVAAPAWYRMPVAPDFLAPDSVGRVWLHQWNTSASNSQTFPWARIANANSNADPGAGNWGTRNNDSTVRVSFIDDDGTDRGSVITDGSLIGSRLRMTQQTDTSAWSEYTIGSVNEEAGWVWYDTSNKTTGPNGEPAVGAVCDIEFQVPVLASVDYVTLAGHLSPYPALQSYIAFDDPQAGLPSQDGVGINVVFQAYYLSPDWDIQAYSGGAPATAGEVQQLTKAETDWVKVSTEAFITFKDIPTTDNTWTTVHVLDIPVGAAKGGTGAIKAVRQDAPDYYITEVRAIAFNTGGGVAADDNQIYELGQTQLDVRLQAVGLTAEVQVRGQNNQDWSWSGVFYFSDL